MTNDIQKFHVYMYMDYRPLSTDNLKGLVYTTGFKHGDKGYVVNVQSGTTTELKVISSFKMPVIASGQWDSINTKPIRTFIQGEFVVNDMLYLVNFSAVQSDEPVSLPAHEVLSVS